jgi:hypothetical protein
MSNIAPIRSQAEITTIITNAQVALASLGSDIINEQMQDINQSNPLHRAKIYRLILLDIYLFNVLDRYGNILNFFTAPINTVLFNNILTGMQNLANMSGPAIPLLLARNGALQYYQINSSTNPFGQTFMIYIGGYNASGNQFPTIGSGPGSTVAMGNMWSITGPGQVGGVNVLVGAMIMAKVNNPGQTLSNWFIWF